MKEPISFDSPQKLIFRLNLIRLGVKTMLFRQYPQVFLTSFLIVGLTGRASIAFNIIPQNPGATKFYRPESTYQIDKNREGITEIDMGLGKLFWLMVIAATVWF